MFASLFGSIVGLRKKAAPTKSRVLANGRVARTPFFEWVLPQHLSKERSAASERDTECILKAHGSGLLDSNSAATGRVKRLELRLRPGCYAASSSVSRNP